MSTTYSYTISTDFPAAKVNVEKLVTEIQISPITIAFDNVVRNGDNIDLTFKEALNASNKTILDGNTTNPAGGLIANHDNTPSIPTDISSDAILEAASGRIVGERTITLTGLKRDVDDQNFSLIRTGLADFPRVLTPSTLTVESDDPNENTNGAIAVGVEWLDENWSTNQGVFVLSGTNQVQITSSAMRLQKARIAASAQPFGSNSGTLTFMLGTVNAGVILPGEGQMHRMFFTTPANTDVRFLGYQVSCHQNGSEAFSEIRLCAVSPVDAPNPPEACLFPFFTIGMYGSNNIYVPSIPEKTDLFFSAKNLNVGTMEVAMTVTLYERPK